MYKLHDWVDINKINWDCLSENRNAIKLLEENEDKINWSLLSSNSNAIKLLNNNKDKIKFRIL